MKNRNSRPDREKLDFGSDNNYEYKLYGYFSGDRLRAASNTIYPISF